MKHLFALVLKELIAHRRFTLLFILNLSLGLSGLMALNHFQISFENSVKKKSQTMLGADFAISSRKPISNEIIDLALKIFDQPARRTNTIEFYSMVSQLKGDSKLVQIKAIEEIFPFYGHIDLSKNASLSEKNLFSKNSLPSLSSQKAWVYPEVIAQLDVKIGDEIQIGAAKFTITAIVKDDATSGISTDMAPRIYISLHDVQKTQLVSPESLVWHTSLFAFSQAKKEDLQKWEETLHNHSLLPTDVKVSSHQTASQEMGTMIQYLNDYLGLVALAAIFLCAVGSVFLFRAYFFEKISDFAILLSLGLRPNQLLGLILIQMGALGFLATLPALIFSIVLIPLITWFTQALLPLQIESHWNFSSLLIASIVAILGSIFVCLPTALKIKEIKLGFLLRQEFSSTNNKSSLLNLFAYLPALVGFWGMTIWQSHSWKIGTLFFLVFIGCGIFLGALGFVSIKLLPKFFPARSPIILFALRDLSRHQYSTLSSFLALSLGILLLNIAPQIEANLQGELNYPQKSKLPRFFLFDIQEDQLTPLQALLSRHQLPSLNHVSPLIRARLMAVNHEAFTKGKQKKFSREEERESRFRNRGFNLTYRSQLSAAESIVEGKDIKEIFQKEKNLLPEISVEKNFASRLNLKIGDILTFDVQDIQVEGKISNFRSIKWTSFQPNFFIQFQPGVLEEAPKTYLASLPQTELKLEKNTQNIISREFPNISILDVSRLVARLLDLARQIGWALTFMAGLNILAGIGVLFSIIQHQMYQRQWEMSLLKVLGSETKQIRQIFVGQFLVITFAAGMIGVLMSLAVSFFISSLLFDGIWVWQWKMPLLSLFSLLSISLSLGLITTRKVATIKPNVFLRQLVLPKILQ